MKTLLAALCVAALPAFAQPALLPQPAQTEIDHLFDYVAHSDCRFNRNGSWHGMDEARDHMAMKLDYLRARNQVDSAEAFIDKAASRSSMSGKDYLVQCPGGGPVPSEAWLKAELNRFRRGKS